MNIPSWGLGRCWRMMKPMASCTAVAVTVAALAVAPVTAMAADGDLLNIAFGGSFETNNYTTGGSEIARGAVHHRGAKPQPLDGGGVRLAGGANGVTFTAHESFGSGAVGTAFTAEFEYRADTAPGQLDTLFSAMGNIFVRAAGANLEYGMSSNPSEGIWHDYRQTVAMPANGGNHIIQLRYEPGSGASGNGASGNDTPGAALALWVDGVAGPVASAPAGERAAISPSADRMFGIGCEVNPDAGGRGFAADLYRVRIAGADAAWEFLDAAQLISVDFDGAFPGDTYMPSASESVRGRLTARGGAPALADSAVALSGGAAGLDFAPTDFSLGTDAQVTQPWLAEMRFTPSSTDGLRTLVAAGGNLFLRYEQGRLVFGASTVRDGVWRDHKLTADAPAGAEHVASVAYVPHGATSTLYLRVDGGDTRSLDVDGLAALDSALAHRIGLGNEVHPDALDRGFAGTIGEIRLATTTDAFADDEFRMTYVQADCDVSGIMPSNTFDVTPSECEASLKAKLSALRPTAGQADYIDWGRIGFLHYGVNTYYDQGWGHGDEDPMRVDPTDLDTDQWARAFADAGFKMIMVTVKHHDGFELYDSRYNTEHDWANTAAAKKTGKTDLFRQVVDSARRYGLKVGIYYSPADSWMERQGVWGNNSPRVERTIPTLVEGDDRAAQVASGQLPTFTYRATDYGAYMLNQLYELLTEYGDIAEVWFDGAQGNTVNTEHYDYGVFYEMIRALQPDALQVNAAYDARWVGNEAGWARETEWSPQAAFHDGVDKVQLRPGELTADGVLGSTGSVLAAVRAGAANQLHWYPAEVDAKNGPEWFSQGNHVPKSVATVSQYYEQATGRNAQLLLNVPPAKSGLLSDGDVAQLRGLDEELARRYGTDLALGRAATVAAAADAQAVPAPKLTDGSKLSSDEAVGDTPVYTVDLGEPTAVDAVTLGEDVRSAGQQIERAVVQGRVDGEWTDLVQATTVGQQRNLRFGATTVDALRLVVTASRGPVRLSRFAAFRTTSTIQPRARVYYIDPGAPVAGDGTGPATPMCSIEQLHDVSLAPGSVLLVRAGTTLTGDFAVFGYGTADAPITVSRYGDGGMPTASFAGLEPNLPLSEALRRLGKDQAGWTWADSAPPLPDVRAYVPQHEITVADASSYNDGNEAAAVLDGDSSTIWHSRWSPSQATGPHWLVLDLGQRRRDVAYLDYLGRLDGNANGMAKRYRVYVSDDRDSFGDPVAEGTLENVPYTQRIAFTPTSGRYVKFQIDADHADAGFGSAAEINIETLPVAADPPASLVDPDTSDTPGETVVPGASDDKPGRPEMPGAPGSDSGGRPGASVGDAGARSDDRSWSLAGTGACVTAAVGMALLALLCAGGTLLIRRRR